jgi:hypothetical protein
MLLIKTSRNLFLESLGTKLTFISTGQGLHRVPISRTLKWLMTLLMTFSVILKDTIVFPTPKLV